MRPRDRRPVALVLALLAIPALPGPGAAQSLLNSSGLGLPLGAVDARSRALGSVGVGLFGSHVLPYDPAAAADLTVPEVNFTLQQSQVDIEGPGDPDASGARFPLLGVAYPVYDAGVVFLSIGGVLDQRWQTRRSRELDLGGETVDVTDRFVSTGGVSAVRLGFARRLGSNLAVGITAGRYTGDLRRTFTRTFDSLEVGSAVAPFTRGGTWGYSGTTLSAGAQVDVGAFLRVGGSVTWSGDLEAEPDEETEGAPSSFAVPAEFRVGASGSLTPTLDLTVGLSYADWTGAGDEDEPGRGVFSYGAGFELSELTLAGRSLPLRLGYRNTQLPFAFDGEEPSESVFAGGLGVGLLESQLATARLDLAVETGERSAGALTESFWRASVSVRVGGT